jgi:kinesin family protein 13
MMGTQGNEGIIPRLCNSLFEQIADKTSPSLQAKVEVSYMEIYNEKIYDLLDPMTSSSTSKQSLRVREHNALGSYVDGLSQLAVISYQVTIQPKVTSIGLQIIVITNNCTFHILLLLTNIVW